MGADVASLGFAGSRGRAVAWSNSKITAYSTAGVLIFALIAGGWALVVRAYLSPISADVAGIKTDVKDLGTRMGKVEQQLAAITGRVVQVQSDMESSDKVLLAELQKRQQETSAARARAQKAEDAALKAREESLRRLMLAEARSIENQLLADLPKTVAARTTTGFFRAYVPGENQLVVEDAEGRTIGFKTRAAVEVRSICGMVKETQSVASLQRGMPVLVAYAGTGTTREALLIGRSSCV